MLNNISEAPNYADPDIANKPAIVPTKPKSSYQMRTSKDITGKSAQTTELTTDRLRKSTNPGIQDIVKKSDILDKLLSGPKGSQIAAEVDKLTKTDNVKQHADSDYRPNRLDNVYPGLDDSIDYNLDNTNPQAESIELDELVDDRPRVGNMEVPINVLSNVMGDDTDVNLMRQALRQINNERGINKRFMPALKQFLSPYLTILGSGFTGYNQIMALQKALAQKNWCTF
jgi:hypothetical protein